MNINLGESFSSKKMIFLAIILFIVVNFSVVYALVIPTIKTIKEKGEQIIKSSTELEINSKKFNNIGESRNSTKNIDKRISAIEDNFMNKGEELSLIKILEETASKNNVIQTITPGSSQQGTDSAFSTMGLKLVITGNFKNILDYIQDIESLNYYVNIDSINISKSKESHFSDAQDSNQVQEVTCAISAKTYWKNTSTK